MLFYNTRDKKQDAIKFIADQNNIEIVSLIGEDTSKVLCDYLNLTLWVA